MIKVFLICAHFLGNKSRAQNKDYCHIIVYNVWCGLHNQLCRSVLQLGIGSETACKPT